MPHLEFKELWPACWNKDKYCFIVIDKSNEVNQGRYRKGFNCFMNLRN